MVLERNISFLPTDALSYDPTESGYWDAQGCDSEIRRVFEVCHSCRLCFKYCDTFPRLFTLLDDTHAGNVRKLADDDIAQVMAAC